MKGKHLRSLLYTGFCGFYALGATAAVSLFSDYGQIQNVQNYSTNPFWSPNAPYNQRMPQPVYVQGADLNDKDCFDVVQSLVSAQCMMKSNCKNTSLSDIRPTIMVQLSNLKGNNYVSACSGYIDYVFEQYVKQYANSIPNSTVSFPGATTPVQTTNNTIQIKNPYKQTNPKWKQDIIDRSKELQQLQQQNGAGSEQISKTDFPATYNDIRTFKQRIEDAAEDYAKYKDLKAYVIPNFQDADKWCSGEGSGTALCTKMNNCKKLRSDPYAVTVVEDEDGNCTITECKAGYELTSNGQKCESKANKKCDSGDPNATAAKFDEDGVTCIITACKLGYATNETKTACESLKDKPCECEAPKATVCKYDDLGQCRVEACEQPGFFVSQNKKECEALEGKKCTPTDDPYATEGVYDAQGNCESFKCKYGYDVVSGKCKRNICPLNSTIPLLNPRTKGMFAFADVQTPAVAQKILQLLIKCSDTPDAKATANYITRGGSGRSKQDYMFVHSADDSSTLGEFEFDDVTDGYRNQYYVETFLCIGSIAFGGGTTNVAGSHDAGSVLPNEESLTTTIDDEQFEAIKKAYANIMGIDGYTIQKIEEGPISRLFFRP